MLVGSTNQIDEDHTKLAAGLPGAEPQARHRAQGSLTRKRQTLDMPSREKVSLRVRPDFIRASL
jgi:hypothetical protein